MRWVPVAALALPVPALPPVKTDRGFTGEAIAAATTGFPSRFPVPFDVPTVDLMDDPVSPPGGSTADPVSTPGPPDVPLTFPALDLELAGVFGRAPEPTCGDMTTPGFDGVVTACADTAGAIMPPPGTEVCGPMGGMKY